MKSIKPKLLTLQQIAKVVGLCDDRAAMWLKREMKKGLPAMKVGKAWRLDSDALYNWLKTGGKSSVKAK